MRMLNITNLARRSFSTVFSHFGLYQVALGQLKSDTACPLPDLTYSTSECGHLADRAATVSLHIIPEDLTTQAAMSDSGKEKLNKVVNTTSF